MYRTEGWMITEADEHDIAFCGAFRLQLFETWQDAKAALIVRANREAATARRELQRAEARVVEMECLRQEGEA